MTPDAALAILRASAEPGRAAGMAAYHKQTREVIGIANPVLNDLARDWRRALDLDDRLAVASGLWATDVFEARIMAAKLLTQARIRPDDAAWRLIASWRADFDSWAIADHACMAGQKRLTADPSRLDEVDAWTRSAHMWTRRAALVITLPFAKSNHPKPHEEAARDRILSWCAGYASDPCWFIQKAVAWWVRDLSKHDAPRAQLFITTHGSLLKPFALREASKYL